MQDDLTDAVGALRAQTDAFLAARVLTTSDDVAHSIRRALEVQAAADDLMRAVVVKARQDGVTWQVIGAALGVTRQAAFTRYGKPVDPRTGDLMDTTPLPGAAELAAAVIDHLAGGRWSRVTAQFDPTVRDGLSEDALASAWAQIVGLSGAFEHRGPTEVLRAGEFTVTNTPLYMEAGDYTARISFRDDRAIAGVYILEKGVS